VVFIEKSMKKLFIGVRQSIKKVLKNRHLAETKFFWLKFQEEKIVQ
jgi:hypothetical protein